MVPGFGSPHGRSGKRAGEQRYTEATASDRSAAFSRTMAPRRTVPGPLVMAANVASRLMSIRTEGRASRSSSSAPGFAHRPAASLLPVLGHQGERLLDGVGNVVVEGGGFTNLDASRGPRRRSSDHLTFASFGLMAAVDAPNLSLNEWAVLALIAERPTHGWRSPRNSPPTATSADMDCLAPPRVSSPPPPRAARSHRIARRRTQPRWPGARTTRHHPGRSGRRRSLALFALFHVRDYEARLLLQLRLLDRRGLDLRPLATVQLEQLTPILASLRDRAGARNGFADLLARWRYESTGAAARFLESLIDQQPNRPTSL